MAVSAAAKRYCINNLVAMAVETIQADAPQRTSNDILAAFTKSKTYELLCDTETGLWTEGPAYIVGLYEEELQQSNGGGSEPAC